MTPNSAADRAFLAEPRDEEWAAFREADVRRRIWGICQWSKSVIEEITCRTSICRVTMRMRSPSVLGSLFTNIEVPQLYGAGVTGLEWNELEAPERRFRAVYYLAYPDRDMERQSTVRNSRSFALIQIEHGSGGVRVGKDLPG